MSSIPVTMTSQGAVPTSPDTIRSNLESAISAQVPGYTADLPGTLIEDVLSTDVGAVAVIDQARVDAINSLTPYGANEYVLNQMGVLFGLPRGKSTNPSAYVQFSGPAGYAIPAGWVVGDGTYQYTVQDGIIIGTSGVSGNAYVIATQSGTWTPAKDTITQMISQLPVGVSVTVNNPVAGYAGTGEESVQEYRSRILPAFSVTVQGVGTYLKTLLYAVPGVAERLVSVRQVSAGWKVICAGGDPYAMGYAIYQGTMDLATIVGSSNSARNTTVTITDGPNTYDVIYVTPVTQTVDVTATWNTTMVGFTAVSQVNSLAQNALVNYINGITVGAPLNLLEMDSAFADAVSSVLAPDELTTLEYSISVNGSVVTPSAGTHIISSDPEGYFSAQTISVVQG